MDGFALPHPSTAPQVFDAHHNDAIENQVLDDLGGDLNEIDDVDHVRDAAVDSDADPPHAAAMEPHVAHRYPRREHKPPGEWWKAPQTNLASRPAVDQFFGDTIAHIEYAALNAATCKRLLQDKLPRPDFSDTGH